MRSSDQCGGFGDSNKRLTRRLTVFISRILLSFLQNIRIGWSAGPRTKAMKPNRITVKFFLAPDPHASVDLGPFIPLFHRLIQQQRVEGLLIDVADYAHVPEGPGVILIGHDVDYGIDQTGGKAGLLVTAKRNESEELPALLRTTLRRALVAIQAIEAENESDVVFESRGLELRILDRLASGKSDADFEPVLASVRPVLEELYRGANLNLSREFSDEPRQAFTIRLEGARRWITTWRLNSSEAVKSALLRLSPLRASGILRRKSSNAFATKMRMSLWSMFESPTSTRSAISEVY